MLISLLLMAGFLVAGNIAFWHFDPKQARWRRVLKIVLALGITALLWHCFGRVGVVVWFGLIFVPLIWIHGIWLPMHGVNGWTGEPREKYHALRGWPPPQR
jgi:hypothetical protein